MNEYEIVSDEDVEGCVVIYEEKDGTFVGCLDCISEGELENLKHAIEVYFAEKSNMAEYYEEERLKGHNDD